MRSLSTRSRLMPPGGKLSSLAFACAVVGVDGRASVRGWSFDGHAETGGNRGGGAAPTLPCWAELLITRPVQLGAIRSDRGNKNIVRNGTSSV